SSSASLSLNQSRPTYSTPSYDTSTETMMVFPSTWRVAMRGCTLSSACCMKSGAGQERGAFGGLAQERAHGAEEFAGRLHVRHVPAPVQRHQPGVGERARDGLRCGERYGVLPPVHDERRATHARERG